MSHTFTNLKNILILVALSYFFFIIGNGIISLTNPDEVFYAQTAKEMLKYHSWMTPYLFSAPQFEKPIFLYWLLRIGFAVFGIGSFAGRFFPAVFASIGVIAVYLLCLLGFKNEKKAFISSLILMSCGLYIGLARTIFTDMIFSVFILLSLLSFFWGYLHRQKKAWGVLLFFISSSFAVLTKGPLGFFIPVLIVTIFLAIRKDLRFIFCKYSLWGLLIFILLSFPWYIFMIKRYGNAFSYEFFYNDHIRRLFEAEHITNDTWYFYALSILPGMFPWSIYVAIALVYLFKNLRRNSEPIYLFLACWIAAVFLIFQPAHSKLVSYLFPLFPALAVASGDFIYNASVLNKKTRSIFYGSLITVVALIILLIGLTICLPYILNYIPSRLPFYILISLFLILTTINFILVMRGEFLKSVYILMLFIPAIFCIIPLVNRDIEPFLSSADSCAYLLKNYNVDNTILTSKFFSRGLRYYTDKQVAVIDIPGENFFSPHPIPFLNSDQKAADFLRKQPVTYAVLKKSSVEDIQRLAKEFEIRILKIIGNEYIVKIKPWQQ